MTHMTARRLPRHLPQLRNPGYCERLWVQRLLKGISLEEAEDLVPLPLRHCRQPLGDSGMVSNERSRTTWSQHNYGQRADDDGDDDLEARVLVQCFSVMF